MRPLERLAYWDQIAQATLPHLQSIQNSLADAREKLAHVRLIVITLRLQLIDSRKQDKSLKSR